MLQGEVRAVHAAREPASWLMSIKVPGLGTGAQAVAPPPEAVAGQLQLLNLHQTMKNLTLPKLS